MTTPAVLCDFFSVDGKRGRVSLNGDSLSDFGNRNRQWHWKERLVQTLGSAFKKHIPLVIQGE